GDAVGHPAPKITRERRGRPRDHVGVVEPQLVRGNEQRPAEALELERALGLRINAVPEAVPPEQGKRPYDEDNDAREGEKRTAEPATPGEEAEHRQQCERIQLRRDGEPEQRE